MLLKIIIINIISVVAILINTLIRSSSINIISIVILSSF